MPNDSAGVPALNSATGGQQSCYSISLPCHRDDFMAFVRWLIVNRDLEMDELIAILESPTHHDFAAEMWAFLAEREESRSRSAAEDADRKSAA